MEKKKFSDQEVNEELANLQKAREKEEEGQPIFKSNLPKTDLNKVLKSD